ncbi:hypothetical protein H0E87_002933 [Populus deltoides]|uniref:KANL3/Tex30 alpha/beta hydrolase-like domain-containing protein n=1 Tax=Populus deltoides TaxID=3696 RepID=A0A8T2ZX16_POPDE|nr:hypothetical protein H0E87_002933 [Populus deltoides]
MDSSPPTKRRRKTKSEGTNDKSSSSPVVVFAHGAGAPSSSDWMLRWKEMLKNALDAVEVVTFDYPYIAGGKKRAPPKAEKLVEFHKDIVKKTTDKYPAHPLILAGKSMGSRVSCMVAAEVDIDASAVICLGYPLKVHQLPFLPVFFLVGHGWSCAGRDSIATYCPCHVCTG